MEMVRVPAGEFVMGPVAGDADERPLARVRIDKALWMSVTEVTNAQFARFDAVPCAGFRPGNISLLLTVLLGGCDGFRDLCPP